MAENLNFYKIKEEIKNCNKCPLSKTRNNALPGEGNLKARVMLVAQAPGEKEDEDGRMFVGPTGTALDELFGELGIERDSFYLTNLVKCMLPDYRKPQKEEIDACSEYLNQEIDLIEPEIISPLGYYSTHYICNKYNYTLPDKKRDFKNLYGKLLITKSKKIYPLIHPTALIFENTDKEKIRTNYSKLKTLLSECKWYSVCPMKRFYENGLLESKWVELYCKGDWKSCTRYKMEENGEYHPDWMLPDGSIDNKLKQEDI
ncbi:uracil-DNA glycosylase [candidate division WOR-3 bacterium]|nr:uracil-DNA glycosylase [candidate division WOR-3 bacterium]